MVDKYRVCWNVAGWGSGVGSKFRELVVSGSKLDVICVCESHLIADEVLSIDGYIWFGNNCKHISPRARKGSGGVGILAYKRAPGPAILLRGC